MKPKMGRVFSGAKPTPSLRANGREEKKGFPGRTRETSMPLRKPPPEVQPGRKTGIMRAGRAKEGIPSASSEMGTSDLNPSLETFAGAGTNIWAPGIMGVHVGKPKYRSFAVVDRRRRKK